MLGVAEASAEIRPEYGGVVRTSLLGPLGNPDPSVARTAAQWQAVRWTHAGLYRHDQEGTPVVDLLAAPCERGQGGRRFDCRLRSGLRFHDGRALDAAAVQRSFEQLSGPREWVRDVLSVRVLGPRRLRLSSKVALSSADLAALLASPALVVVDGSPRVGAGPFRIHRFGARRIVWRAFDRHHGGRPYLDRIEATVRAVPQRVVEDFSYERADLVFVDSDRYREAKRRVGPARQSLGVVFRGATEVLLPGALREAAAARTTARALPSRQRWPGGPVVPEGTQSLSVGRLGVSPGSADVGAVVAAQLGQWTIEPLDGRGLVRAWQGEERVDALLVWWTHLEPDRWAHRSIGAGARLAGGRGVGSWQPLVAVPRVAVATKRLRGARFDASGCLLLADAWLEAR